MNGSTLGAAATETPFNPHYNAVGHVHHGPTAPVHPEHEREPRTFYDECQVSPSMISILIISPKCVS